jgi:peptide/nickel transport system substrate-binding protein/oligopeptide transport system substrate-binding protein
VSARRARFVAGVAVVALAAAACGGSGGKSGGNAFSVAINEPDHLTPAQTTSSYSLQVGESLFDPLTAIDPQTKKVSNLAAQSVTSSDQKHWTIKIKPGLKFSNGEKVTAKSFVDAWNTAAYGPNGWAANYYFANIKGYDALNPSDEKAKPKSKEMSGLKVKDDTTFDVTLTEPYSQFPMTLAVNCFAPLPKAGLTDFKKFDNHPIGNGPYMMDGDWQHNKQIKVKKNPDYTGSRKGNADEVTFKSYASRDAAYTDLSAGKTDALATIPAAKVLDAKKTFGDRFRAVPGGTMDYLGFPLFEKQYSNVKLRQAISMAIDRQGIVKSVYNGTYKPMGSLVPPIVPGYRANPCGQYCQYNPTQAKALLKQAGGFKGTMNLWFSNADPTYQAWMQSIANLLKQNLGINAKFRQVPAADYLDTLSGHKEDGPYRQNWIMDYPSPENYLANQWGVDNRMGWKGPDYDKFTSLIKKGDAASTQEASVPFYQQAEDVALKDMTLIPLWNWQDQSAWSKRLSNVINDPIVGFHVESIKVSG